MLADNKKISLKQALFLFLSMVFPFAVRFIPSYTAQKAKQGAYISPILAAIVLLFLILLLHGFFKRYGDGSILDIISRIIGTFMGKVIAFIYLIWMIILLGVFVRYYSEKLASTIFPYAGISLFTILMLGFVAMVLHSGLVTLARMNEIILVTVNLVVFLVVLFLVPQIDIKKLTPVSYLDFIPIAKGSLGVSGPWTGLWYIFILGDEINNKERLNKDGPLAALFLLIATRMILVGIVGTMGYTVVGRAPIPLTTAAKIISVFGILEKVESIVVVIMILVDFVAIAILATIILKTTKILFGLEDSKPLINMYMVLTYFVAMLICRSRYELEDFSVRMVVPMNLILCVAVPSVIFLIGLLRKKRSPQ